MTDFVVAFLGRVMLDWDFSVPPPRGRRRMPEDTGSLAPLFSGGPWPFLSASISWRIISLADLECLMSLIAQGQDTISAART